MHFVAILVITSPRLTIHRYWFPK